MATVAPVVSTDLIAQERISRVLLTVGLAIFTYELNAKIVQSIAKDFFSWKITLVTVIFSCLATLQRYEGDMYDLQKEFAAICFAYVLVKLVSFFLESYQNLPDYMTDMDKEAKEGMYISMVGYEDVIRKVEIAMKRKKKSNAILISFPGVGKTAVPETIAYNIANKKFPKNSLFARARLIRVDFIDIMQGTKFRGSLEERIKEMINISKKDPSIIYFIDEFFMVVGGGKTLESSVDISQLLLRPMSRGEIKVLAASTIDEYNQMIVPKGALRRRIPPVIINEPTPQQCYKMLCHSYSQICHDGQVKLSLEAVAAAIFFTREDENNHYPDKAVGVIDDAIAAAELALGESDEEVVLGMQDIARSYIQAKHSDEAIESCVQRFKTFVAHNPNCFEGLELSNHESDDL